MVPRIAVLFLFVNVAIVVGDLNLLLLHNNDMHARFEQVDQYCGPCANDTSPACYGGFARTKSQVEALKQKATHEGRLTIFLNAGDSYQGTPYYTFFKWPIVAKFVSMLELDVMSLGNHEFDDGVAGLAPYIGNVTVPIVCCNLDISQEPRMNQTNLMPSKVLTVNDTKIGVIGYLTPETKSLSDPGKVRILDEIPSLQAEVGRLQAEGVNILIALGHSGYVKDQEIAQEVEGLDLVVGGHSHTFLYSGPAPDVDEPKGPYPTVVTQRSGRKVPVVQAFYATKYLGYLELDFDDNGELMSYNGQPVLLKGDLPQDWTILDGLRPYEHNISATIHTIVGTSTAPLDGGMVCKLGECGMGNLITDAYIDYVSRHLRASTGCGRATVAINQAGGIRASINPQTNIYQNGSVSLEDVMTVLPWGGRIDVLNMTGEILRQALEFSVQKYEDTILGHVSTFLQVSGLRVHYDMRRPSGSRLVSAAVLCGDCDSPRYDALNVSKTYTVAMPQYIATGGDAFDMFVNISDRVESDDVDYQIISQYITLHSPVSAPIEGRINITNATPSSSAKSSFTSSNLMLYTLVLSVVFFNVLR